MKIVLLIAAVIGADQISKYIVRMTLAEGESFEHARIRDED